MKSTAPPDLAAATAEQYLRLLDDVTGWFLPVDARILMGIDALQRERGIRGDVMEIGVNKGKSGILLGYLPRDSERLIACDIFEDTEGIGQEELPRLARGTYNSDEPNSRGYSSVAPPSPHHLANEVGHDRSNPLLAELPHHPCGRQPHVRRGYGRLCHGSGAA